MVINLVSEEELEGGSGDGGGYDTARYVSEGKGELENGDEQRKRGGAERIFQGLLEAHKFFSHGRDF